MGFALYIAAKYVRRRHLFSELQIARFTPVELKHLIDEGRAPTIVDLPIGIEKRNGRIPGARSSLNTWTHCPNNLKVGEFVLYCSCPNEGRKRARRLKLKRRVCDTRGPSKADLRAGLSWDFQLRFGIALIWSGKIRPR